jgi:major membrane immunogen (membrane-anchored lipoprotein)
MDVKFVLSLFFITAFTLGCAFSPGSGENSRRSAVMQDGYYTASAVELDDHGWKEYVTIYVSRGKILTVEYNAVNGSGFVKSWDMDYMRIMNAVNGTYPNAYTRQYAAQLVKTQDAEKIDALSGASNSWHTFKQLAAAAMENARSGSASPGTVLVLLDHGETGTEAR